MRGRRGHEDDSPRGWEPLRLVLCTAAGFSLAVGAWLGATGFRTSGFAFTMTLAQMAPLVALVFAVHAGVGLVLLLLRFIAARGKRRWRAIEGTLARGMATVTLWGFLGITFLPLKGSETFVPAGTLTTFQLNLAGLSGVIVGGLLIGSITGLVVTRVISVLRRRLTVGGMRAVGLVAAVAAVVVLVAGPAWRARALPALTAPEAALPRVAVIGVDGCDWEKLDPLLQDGRLPTFRRLMDEGCHGPLLSLEELVSPRIWTTIATGKTAGKHGIRGFVNEAGVPVNSTMLEATPIWEIVSAHGATVGVVGWYVTWPADSVNGFLISDRLHSLLRGPVQMLQSVAGESTNNRLESFGSFSFDPTYKRYPKTQKHYQRNRIVDEPLRWGYLRDLIYSRIAFWLLPNYRPHLSAIYFRGVDFVQHFFWKYSDPEPFGDVSRAEIAAYGDVIPSYYVYQDGLLERLLEALGDEVNVIVVSDHGFKARLDPDPNRPQLTGMHDRSGVFIASGPAFRSSGRFEGATVFDVAPTVLAVMGLPVPEDMDGRVLVETIREDHLAKHPVTSIPSYEPLVGKERAEVGSPMDESIREQLRSLGYIE